MVPWGGVQKPWLKQNQPYRAYQPQSFSGPSGWGSKGSYSYNSYSYGKGSSPWQQRRPAPSVPSGFQADPNQRFYGTVLFYHKWRGYGFIEPTPKGSVPLERVFVHWKNLSSDDRFPFLVQGLEVEFSLVQFKDWQRGGSSTLRASNVTLVGGMHIAMQDELDSTQKTFVGGQHLRYTGTLKFFSPRGGFGFVVMDQGYDVDPSVPSELKVDKDEVNSGGQQPGYMQNLAVEFGIYKSQRGPYKVYNMTLPGGHPLTQDALENRISMGLGSYRGEVVIWNARFGFGFIRPDPSVIMPQKVLAKLEAQASAARARGRHVSEDKLLYFRRADVTSGLNIFQGSQVGYQIYIDDKGAGASDVTA